MLTLGRSYEAHRKKLTEIREGRHKPPLQHDFGSDPTLELSKVNLSRHKLVNRHFQATGITLRGERVERLLGMERETKALVNRLEDIQRGKLVFGNRGRAGIEFDTNTTEPDERCFERIVTTYAEMQGNEIDGPRCSRKRWRASTSRARYTGREYRSPTACGTNRTTPPRISP